MKLLTFKEAFEDLHNRMQKQLAETIWTIERIKPMDQQAVEIFQGKGVKKKMLMKELEIEKETRKGNLKVISEILKNYGNKSE